VLRERWAHRGQRKPRVRLGSQEGCSLQVSALPSWAPGPFPEERGQHPLQRRLPSACAQQGARWWRRAL
jgi:hypothetical protein